MGEEGEKKSIFTSINDIQSEMTNYDKFIKQTKMEMSQNPGLSLKSDLTVNNVEEKSKNIEAEGKHSFDKTNMV